MLPRQATAKRTARPGGGEDRAAGSGDNGRAAAGGGEDRAAGGGDNGRAATGGDSGRAAARALDTAERLATEARDALDELAGAPAPHLHAAVRACALACARDVFASENEPPADVERLARLWAQMRLELPPLLRGVRLAHAALSHLWLEEIGAAEPELLQVSADGFFDYADRVAAALTEHYERERAARENAPERRRLELVHRVLAGDPVADQALGYRLHAMHVGVVAWGPDAELAARALADAVGGDVLLVHIADELVWAWCGVRENWRRRLERVPAIAATVAVGAPARGPDGFRRTHEEALAAARVAARLPDRITLHQDVALEALTVADEELARAFVTRELGSLAERDPRAARLRDTLRVYLGACGQNAAATAAALGVHDQTVRSQLRTIEQRLGRAIAQRHAELATALRLHALFAESE